MTEPRHAASQQPATVKKIAKMCPAGFRSHARDSLMLEVLQIY